ncbi:MAG TPA: MFS transporter, partial [Gemmatimonadaceae bacterium]|nr:MFS transporter [Gemmatimonadaceae bacterium]
KRIAQDGPSTIALGAIALGLVLATVFVHRQTHLEHPLIDLALFEVPAFTASVCTQLIATITFGGLYLLVSQYLQLVLGLSPIHAGISLLPATVVGVLGTIAAPLLVKRLPIGLVMPAGMILTSLGILLLSTMAISSGIRTLVIAYVIMSFGVNIAMTLTTDMIMSVAPPERAGAASGISETSAELGAALGIALLGSVSTAYYRRAMSSAAPEARATLAGAIEYAQSGGDGGLALAAREAFTSSLNLVALISAALVMITSVATLGILRRINKTS